MGKAEKTYINSLVVDIEDYSLEENINTIQELYNHYGAPNTVVNTYFSMVDTSEIIKKIQLCKWVKRGIIVFLIIVACASLFWGVITYLEYQVLLEEQAVFIDTIIE